jgi:hypothetical protein
MLEEIMEEAHCGSGWAWRSAAASETELQRMLSRATVLHFTGHGTPDGLLLEHACGDGPSPFFFISLSLSFLPLMLLIQNPSTLSK